MKDKFQTILSCLKTPVVITSKTAGPRHTKPVKLPRINSSFCTTCTLLPELVVFLTLFINKFLIQDVPQVARDALGANIHGCLTNSSCYRMMQLKLLWHNAPNNDSITMATTVFSYFYRMSQNFVLRKNVLSYLPAKKNITNL